MNQPQPGTASRTKIAILGGGLGGLAAAFELTNQPGWSDRYEVTVYQKGWRLGGKGASGRSGPHDRIEEHGLHCFWGFYDNAFGMLRTCYDELDRQTGLKTVDDAFKKLGYVHFIDQVGGVWCRYALHFPENGERPGEGVRRTEMSVRELLREYVKGVRDAAGLHGKIWSAFERAAGGELDRKLTWLVGALADSAPRVGTSDANDALLALRLEAFGDDDAARALLDRLKNAERPADLDLEASTDDLLKAHGDPGSAYKWRILFDGLKFAFVVAAGMLADGIPRSLEGFDDRRYDGRDLRTWLGDHGASDELLDSQVVRGLYNASFCFPGGDFSHGDLSAGVSLRTVLLMGFTYRGAFMWKMEASMGDTVFAPLYQALVKRGVTFEFFHKVTKLTLSADRDAVATIEIDRQAEPVGGTYDPLFDVAGLPCWPADPLYDRLENGQALEGFDLESDWCSAEPTGKRVLQRGAEGVDGFDEVVLAIPVGALRSLCGELVSASPSWKTMVDRIVTIRTKSFQLWMKATEAQAAWQARYRIMTDVYRDDFNSVADMSQTLPYETWSPEERPGSVIYFSTAMAEDPAQPTTPDDTYQRSQNERVQQQADEWLAQWQEGIFGWLGSAYDPSAYAERYHRANVSADQRYTLSVAGSASARIAPDGSGFANLYLAGDWTRSPLNLGCAEGATMSGMIAARGLLRASSARLARAVPRAALAERPPPAARRATFIDYPGMPVYPPAYHQKNLTLCQFALEADGAKLQTTVDRLLNAATTDHFVALGRWVLFQTGYIAENRSDGVGARYGTGHETSAAFLIPVVRMRGLVPIEIGMFAPYVFVDQPLSLIAGREVLGMPKHLASFAAPDGRPVGPTDLLDDMIVSTMVVSRFGTDSVVHEARLLELWRPHGKRRLTRRGEGWGEISGTVFDALLASSPTESAALRGMLQAMVDGGRVSFFSVRQLRELADPTRAALQEVTRGVMQLGTIDLRLLAKGHTLQISPFASHPIAADLGLPSGPIVPVAAARITVDEAVLAADP